jgi:hypothetical protein
MYLDDENRNADVHTLRGRRAGVNLAELELEGCEVIGAGKGTST